MTPVSGVPVCRTVQWRVLKRRPDITAAEVGFLGDAYRRLYREPHRDLDAGMAQALDRMWRKHMVGAAA